jgi:hypothetical protein
MKKISRGWCIIAILLLLTSCASLWERTIYERSTHLAQEDGGTSAVLTAASPETLKNVILGMIRSGEGHADIRVTDYPGDFTSLSLSALLNDIQTREPIGAYAVDFMHFDLTTVLSQHSIALTIVYRHEERPPILQVSSGGLEGAVWDALAEYQPLLTLEMQYYDTGEHDPEEIINSFYYNNPAWVERPEVNISLYPASGGGFRRIVELEFEWRSRIEELLEKTDELESAALALLAEMPAFYGSREERTTRELLWVHNELGKIAPYDQSNDAAMLAAADDEHVRGDPYTAYGALVNGVAAAEGYAMAFKLLCDMLDIGCIVGQEPDEEWVRVKIGDDWHYLSAPWDAAALHGFAARQGD